VDLSAEPSTANVVGRMRMDADFDAWTPRESILVILNLARLLDVPVSRVRIESVTRGSVIIQFRIAPASDTGPEAFTLVTQINSIITNGQLLTALINDQVDVQSVAIYTNPEVVLPLATRPQTLQFTISGIRFNSFTEVRDLDRRRELTLAQTAATMTGLNTRLNHLVEERESVEKKKRGSDEQLELLRARLEMLQRNAEKAKEDIEHTQMQLGQMIREKDNQLTTLASDLEWAVNLGSQIGKALSKQMDVVVSGTMAPQANYNFARIAKEHQHNETIYLSACSSAREISLAVGGLIGHLESVHATVAKARDELMTNLQTFKESSDAHQASTLGLLKNVNEALVNTTLVHMNGISRLAEIDADVSRIQQRLQETEKFALWVTKTTEARASVLRQTVAKCDQIASDLDLFIALKETGQV